MYIHSIILILFSFSISQSDAQLSKARLSHVSSTGNVVHNARVATGTGMDATLRHEN